MPVMTGSRFFAETMRGYGVTHLFYVPAPMPEAMTEMERVGVTRVVAHSETAVAYMADGYARASHRPGVCLGQAVGAGNVAAGLRDAYLASSPVIAITGGPQPDSRYRYLYQIVEDFPMFEPVTKLNVRVEKPERLPDLLRQAFRAATSGTPAPVHLEMPGRNGEVVVRDEADFQLIVEERFTRYPAYRPEAEPELVREAVRLLSRAERPVIVAGGGVTASQAAAEVVRLAELLSIPVATSPNGKEVIPGDHPLSAGVVGTYSRWCANRTVSEADLVFFIGTRAGGHTTYNWKIPREGTPVLQLDIDPEEVGRNYPAKVGLCGDAKATLQRLIEVAEPVSSRGAWIQHVQQLVRSWRSEVESVLASDAVPIRPERICQEITDFLPPEAVLVVDTGHAGLWTGTMVELNRPGQRYIRCAGTLGWAFPASLGVKCALPDNPVLCFIGDGGLFYHLSELETAARLGINAVVLVNNNRSLQQVKRLVDASYGGNPEGKGDDQWVFPETNFARIAEEMGCLGIRVEQPGELKGALERAFAAHRPVVVDVVSDRFALPAKPWG
ncbi:MAG: thiamine pyrophosphate-binding protein [Chloroflexi bacterium]|nr:thiamine pyrophosphate-binding protein [Chloroflexota bacterium]